MENSHPGIKKALDLWWIPFLAGIAMICMGLWVFLSPENPRLPLSILFGACLVFVGLCELVFALSGRRPFYTRGWTIAGGIFDILIGGYILFYPGMTVEILPYVLGFWLLFRGFTGIAFSFDLRANGAEWLVFLVISIVIIILGILVLVIPSFSLLHIIIWTACSLVFIGVFRILLAIRLRRAKEEFD